MLVLTASFETKASDVPPTAYDEGGRGIGSLPNPRGVARARRTDGQELTPAKAGAAPSTLTLGERKMCAELELPGAGGVARRQLHAFKAPLLCAPASRAVQSRTASSTSSAYPVLIAKHPPPPGA